MAPTLKSFLATIALITLLAMMLFFPIFILIFFGVLPTFAAFVAEGQEDGYLTLNVGYFNVCSLLPYVLEFFKQEHTTVTVLMILSNPIAWIYMYGGAALGWAIHLIIPNIIISFYVMQARSKIKKLKKRCDFLTGEWGREVMTGGR